MSCNCHVINDIILTRCIMLKEYRIKEGFAQEEMAELLNISWHHYQRIEIGK